MLGIDVLSEQREELLPAFRDICFKDYLIFFGCVCVCGYVHVRAEALDVPRAGVPGACELPDRDARNVTWSLCASISTLTSEPPVLLLLSLL